MIDIVFLLLVFFVMTFRVVTPEGSFNVRMPQMAAPSRDVPPPTELPPLVVKLRAAPGGRLAGIRLGEQNLADFAELRREVRQLVGDDGGARLRVFLVPGRIGVRTTIWSSRTSSTP